MDIALSARLHPPSSAPRAWARGAAAGRRSCRSAHGGRPANHSTLSFATLSAGSLGTAGLGHWEVSFLRVVLLGYPEKTIPKEHMTNLSPLLLHQGEMQEQPGPLSQIVKRMREVGQYRALPPSSRQNWF